MSTRTIRMDPSRPKQRMTSSSVPGIQAGRPLLSLHSVSEFSSNRGRSPLPSIAEAMRSWLPEARFRE